MGRTIYSSKKKKKPTLATRLKIMKIVPIKKVFFTLLFLYTVSVRAQTSRV